MKIEIGESLAYSWLKHVKHCQIVQLNWKLADEWQKHHLDTLESMMARAKTFFSTSTEIDETEDETDEINIFKKNASLNQVISQAECDVLGVHLSDDGSIEVHAAEVAFHSRGLNYSGGKEATKIKIIAKALRSAMGIFTIFGVRKAYIYFLSPKVNPATIDKMKSVEDELNRFFAEFDLNYKFSTCFNDNFTNEIWLPVWNAVSCTGANDTTELCARAMSLQQLTAVCVTKSVNTYKKNTIRATIQEESSSNEYPKYSVGQIVQNALRSKLENITLEEAENFTTKDYTKQFFNLSYSLLCKERGTDAKGRYKYYANPVIIQGRQFYITNDWYDRHRTDLIGWIEKH